MAENETEFAGGLVMHSLAETEELAQRIATGLAAGDTNALEGDLGAGKTSLARAILRALGETGEMPSRTSRSSSIMRRRG
jgi:tRNA threonylcarbamoyladenosine biosynthesis protein TsaE